MRPSAVWKVKCLPRCSSSSHSGSLKLTPETEEVSTWSSECGLNATCFRVTFKRLLVILRHFLQLLREAAGGGNIISRPRVQTHTQSRFWGRFSNMTQSTVEHLCELRSTESVNSTTLISLHTHLNRLNRYSEGQKFNLFKKWNFSQLTAAPSETWIQQKKKNLKVLLIGDWIRNGCRW